MSSAMLARKLGFTRAEVDVALRSLAAADKAERALLEDAGKISEMWKVKFAQRDSQAAE